MIEVCLLIWKRAPRFHLIMKDLKNQTLQDFKINVWNNSSTFLESDALPADRINIYSSIDNVGSQARFRLAKQTTGNPIVFFDDDCILSNDFVEYHYNQYLKFGPDCILGWYNRIFTHEEYWRSQTCAPYGTAVDYVGAAGLVMDRKIIDEEPLLQNIPEEYAKVEDLYLSYLARMKYNMDLISIEKRYGILADEHDQYIFLNKYKQDAFLSLRQQGWRLLKDAN